MTSLTLLRWWGQISVNVLRLLQTCGGKSCLVAGDRGNVRKEEHHHGTGPAAQAFACDDDAGLLDGHAPTRVQVATKDHAQALGTMDGGIELRWQHGKQPCV